VPKVIAAEYDLERAVVRSIDKRTVDELPSWPNAKPPSFPEFKIDDRAVEMTNRAAIRHPLMVCIPAFP
jgi:hypothetical protein